MKKDFPRYDLKAFSRDEPRALFYMTRLERLVKDFKGINNSHSHSFYLVMWITKGTGTHTIDFKSYDVKPHQLYFLTPGQVHSWELSADMEGFNLYFEADFFQSRFPGRLYQYPFFHSHQHKPILETDFEKSLFTNLFYNAYQEYKSGKINRLEVFLSYLHIILESANRLYTDKLTVEDKHYYERIRLFEELIEKHFLDIRDLGVYASMLHISPNHLNHICKIVLGKTASQLLYERRVTEARRLLIHTDLNVKEIGYRLGFEDPSYFVKFFRKHTSDTPQEFRQKTLAVR
ncbi:HTH-type transcriptional activator RhaS [Dyadobacter sp. CECT 9275]|uniref:HTH-type transcriptional activator RhaS n=1 Tax=Dyadobacter helix TaxID=2822344 RepID=A0A916JCE0_9BACT|nr:helix-turn-helix domain-containing protein [Dyadobacter sp. CECT 9275]CAG4998645.1 HTH-type transcriptional activator RhaS [Dyadobacter sp. CECT 9275]